MAFAFESLEVYNRALNFSVSVITRIDAIKTPRKHYQLIEQLEAACTSIALNIAEGKGRFSKKEFRHFLYIARGSLYETVTMLQIFQKLQWLNNSSYQELYSEAEQIGKMLSSFAKSLK